MAVQTATTKSYQVQYVNLVNAAAITDLINAMLSIGYNVSMNAFRTPGVNEVQIVTVTNAIAGDKFTLAYGGVPSSQVTALAATAAQLQTALSAIAGASGNVSVTGNDGGPYRVEFINAMGAKDVNQLVPAVIPVAGSNLAVNVQTQIPGLAPVDNVTFQISKNGANVVNTAYGRYVVFDNGVLSEMDSATFLAKYTP